MAGLSVESMAVSMVVQRAHSRVDVMVDQKAAWLVHPMADTSAIRMAVRLGFGKAALMAAQSVGLSG